MGGRLLNTREASVLQLISSASQLASLKTNCKCARVQGQPCKPRPFLQVQVTTHQKDTMWCGRPLHAAVVNMAYGETKELCTIC